MGLKEHSYVANRLTHWAPLVLLIGTSSLLVGLAWDVLLHELDPALAAREGVMAMGNPGHVIFGAGVALVVLGTTLLLAGQSRVLAGRTRRGRH
jgi:hypothetical protein